MPYTISLLLLGIKIFMCYKHIQTAHNRNHFSYLQRKY